MLTEIYLEYFKCFERLRLPLAPLTLLTGLNASGKSSILQALLLLHQTAVDNTYSDSLLLHGSVIRLGTAGDIVDKVTGRDELTIRLSFKEDSFSWKFNAADKDNLVIPLQEVECHYKDEDIHKSKKKIEYEGLYFIFSPFSTSENELEPKLYKTVKKYENLLENLTYVSADRLGPRETYNVSTSDRRRDVGVNGELTPWYLNEFSYKTVEPMLCKEGNPSTLESQVNAWMGEFFPGSGFLVESLRGTPYVTLTIRSSEGGDFHRPQNVGYGLTHILPIITACLGAGKGDIVLIESPESHLHPAGQSKMGEFLGLVAASGVQVIVETHSDHILNGIRKAVKKNKISHEDVAIHFFNRRPKEDETHIPQVISPVIDGNGNLGEWPKGFFDQFDLDMEYFAGWSE
ncbi:MAG: DUF3696 domain-containing protein [Nitrospirae bacterium YQR-1]